MKWQLLILGLLLFGCVASVGAVRENFQTFSGNLISTGGYPTSIDIYNSSSGQVSFYMEAYFYPSGGYIINTQPSPFTYAAVDQLSDGIYGCLGISLLDSGGNVLSDYHTISVNGHRLEVKMIGSQPTYIVDGSTIHTGSILNINPSSFKVITANCGPTAVDNYLVGESDHHLVGGLPINWSIQRDFINPAATGVYAWNPQTSKWVLADSHYFYIDADTDTTDNIYTENFNIINYNVGWIANTTVIDSRVGWHRLQYDVNQFLNSPNPSSASGIPDGHYYAAFEHSAPDGGISSPSARGDIWVISNGASVSWDKTDYPRGDTGIVTYAITDGYYDTGTYSYRIDTIDIFGNVKKTQTINSQTGTVTIPLTETTYPTGVYYAEVIATKSGTDYVMNYAGMEVTGYIYFNGYVMNAETGSVLSGVNINVTQGTSTKTSTSLTGGLWNSSNNWLSGSPITLNTSLSGYTSDLLSITPPTAKSISLNISLIPSPATSTGVSIGGVVRDNVYSNPITGASVVVRNTTSGEYQTKTTNIAGFYRADNLYSGRLYDIWSSKTGYGNSTVVQKQAVGV
jgi:hypothetical protein